MTEPIALASSSTPCPFCHGVLTETPTQTTYCCDIAELVALRKLRDEFDRRLAFELEAPPQDEHATRFLLWMRARVQRSRSG